MRIFWTVTLSTIGFFSVSASGADLAALGDSSDAIIVGTASALVQTADLVTFDLSVEGVIKGDVTMTVLHIYHPWSRRGVVITGGRSEQPAAMGIRGMWFLKRSPSGGLDVVPANGSDGAVMNLYLPVAQSLSTRYTVPANATPLDRAVVEFAAGAEAEGTGVRQAVELLKSVKTSSVATVAAVYLTSPNPSFQAAGLALSVAQNKPNALADLARLWPIVRSDPAVVHIVNALRDSFRDGAPNSVRQLASIANEFAELRPAALNALAWIHTREALPALAALLQSDDPEEQMRGVIGLSAFANGCPIQTPDNVVTMDYLQFKNVSLYKTPETVAHFAFRRGPEEQERELVAFWRSWWNANQIALTK